MKLETQVQDLLFGMDQVPVEAVLGTNSHTRRVCTLSKKALVNQRTGRVLGVVSRDYRVVTNQEAVNLAREVCGKAFSGLAPIEWDAKRAFAPRTLSYAHIDLMHRTHVLNYYDTSVGQNDPFTPFLRVTNSFNGARALRFDIGFMRMHCSNGVIFEEDVATIKASHSQEALDQLKIEIQSRSLPKMWEEFSQFLTCIRGIKMDIDQSTLALHRLLRLQAPKPDDKPARPRILCSKKTATPSKNARVAGSKTSPARAKSADLFSVNGSQAGTLVLFAQFPGGIDENSLPLQSRPALIARTLFQKHHS